METEALEKAQEHRFHDAGLDENSTPLTVNPDEKTSKSAINPSYVAVSCVTILQKGWGDGSSYGSSNAGALVQRCAPVGTSIIYIDPSHETH